MSISIGYEHAVSAIELYQDYVLETFGVGYLIDLIPITMGDVYVTVGMDLLSRCGALIDSERQLVTVHDLNEEAFNIYNEGSRDGLVVCPTARVRQYIQNGCVAYMVDTRVDRERLISFFYVPIVCDFPDFFWRSFRVCLPRGK